MPSIKLKAPAKINLCLEITGKRKDGYHNLETVMQTIGLHDNITLKTTSLKGIKVKVNIGKDLRPELKGSLTGSKNNLAYRAAELFLKESGINKGVEICLEKNIPIGAGLGGGSSDAASTLAGMNRLFKAGFSRDRLRSLGEKLGMDVPFFIESGTVYATGKGEKLLCLPSLPKLWVILVDPCFSVSTKWAYGNIRQNFLTKKPSCDKILMQLKKIIYINKIKNIVYNTFERVYDRKYPGFLGEVKSSMEKEGAIMASLSGSGPVIFGIFKKRRCAERAFRGLRDKFRKIYLVPFQPNEKKSS